MLQFLKDHPTLTIVLKVVLILLATVVIARLLSAAIRKIGQKLENRKQPISGSVSRKMITKFLVALIYVLGFITAVNQIPSLAGTLTAFLAGSGVIAVIIGFAAQESFGNLISGVFLSIFKPFDVGDRISLPDKNIIGFVEDITLRHTVIRTASDTRAMIPNAIMGSAVVENVDYVSGSLTQIPISVDVSYDADVELAVSVLREALASHPHAAGNVQPRVLVTGFAPSGVSLLGFLPVRDSSTFTADASEARILVKKALDRSGIRIPYQTITISNRSEEDGVRIVTDGDGG